VAEIDRRRTSVLSACRLVMQAVVPNVVCLAGQKASAQARPVDPPPPRGDTVIAENADLRNMPVWADNLCAQNVGGMWLKCGVRPRQANQFRGFLNFGALRRFLDIVVDKRRRGGL
jgi:hypothetical protein